MLGRFSNSYLNQPKSSGEPIDYELDFKNFLVNGSTEISTIFDFYINLSTAFDL